MKLVSFNINGLRSRIHQLSEVHAKHQPAIIGLQEIKVADAAFPSGDIDPFGYSTNYFGQKGHYGVALMARRAPVNVQFGFPWDEPDAQRRMVIADYATTTGPLRVLNGYFPQGESRDHATKFPAKRKFYADLTRYLTEHCDPNTQLVLMGDVNISATDLDVGIGEDNRLRWLKTGKCSFLPEEREWLAAVLDWGLVDPYRQRFANDDSLFSWFDYRSFGFEKEPKRGLRIDLILATSSVADRVVDAGIDYEIRAMPKPSDHCPIWLDVDLELAR